MPLWRLGTSSGQGLETHLGHEVLEAGDDVGALKLLIVAEAASDHNHSNEGQGQVQLAEVERGWVMTRGWKLPV